MPISEGQQLLIRSLVSTPPAITVEELCSRWPVRSGDLAALASSILDRALVDRDSAGVRWGFALAGYCGTAAEHLSTLVALAPQGWHRSHEDIVFFLADLRRPECLSVFADLVNARFDYLAWDDARALAVKCIWGMGKLGTEEAVRVLAALVRTDEPVVSTNARDQLERISMEGADSRAVEHARAALILSPPSPDDE